MQFGQAYIRDVRAEPVADVHVQALAAVLVHEPVEVRLTAQGPMVPARSAGLPQRLQDGRLASVALARRNVRSILCRSTQVSEVASALDAALHASPRDAEDALEDASLEINLRYTLFASPDAVLSIEAGDLLIADGDPATTRIERKLLRDQGSRFFCGEALSRLVSLNVEAVRFSAGAIAARHLQLQAGAVMGPDTAHQHLHKGGWRSIRRVDFIKEYCVACGRCFIHCPDNAVIHAMYNPHGKDTTGILGIDTDRCTACGLCAAVCPANRDGYKAIVMMGADSESSRQAHCVG